MTMDEAVVHDSRVIPDFVFAVSLFYLSTTLLFSRLVRILLRRISYKNVHLPVDDVLSTFQVVACSLENSVTKQTYGYGALTFQLFTLGLLHAWTLTGCGNPCGHVFKMFKRKQRPKITLTSVVFQMIGGLLAWQYAKFMWGLRLSSPHAVKYAAVLCDSDLTTDVWKGFILEFAATFLILCMSTVDGIPVAVKSAVDTTVTVAGVHLTGMYYNPVNATMHIFGCQGASHLTFAVVYWLAPLTGCYLAAVADDVVHKPKGRKHKRLKKA